MQEISIWTFNRCWQRTQWQCRWMQSSITGELLHWSPPSLWPIYLHIIVDIAIQVKFKPGCQMRRSAWPMLKIVITRPDCLHRSSLSSSSWSLSLPLKIFMDMISIRQTSLRNILGTKNLHEILSDRESIALAMQVATKIIWTVGKEGGMWQVFWLESASLLEMIFVLISSFFQGILDDATVAWGIKVERVEMWAIHIYLFFKMLPPHDPEKWWWWSKLSFSKDARLPEQLQRAMAAEAEAAREARAKVISLSWSLCLCLCLCSEG